MTKCGGVTDGKVLAFGGVKVQLPIFGPASAAVWGVLENIMAVSGGGDELNVIFDYRFPWLADLLNRIYLLLFCRHSYITCILVLSVIRLKFKVRR